MIWRNGKQCMILSELTTMVYILSPNEMIPIIFPCPEPQEILLDSLNPGRHTLCYSKNEKEIS